MQAAEGPLRGKARNGKLLSAGNDKKKQLKYLDLFRLIGMLLVMLGHFVDVGCYADSIPNVIATMDETLLSPEHFWLSGIHHFYLANFGVQTAVMGVVIFFISTGYLVAGMMERYTPLEFLVNRVFRIIPCLAVCVLFNGVFLYFLQGLHFSFVQYISSITLTYTFFQTIPVMGVLWTLVIEMFFYLLAALIRKFDMSAILGLYGLVLLAGFARYEFPESHIAISLNYDSRYISFCLQGAMIWALEQENKKEYRQSRIVLLLLSLAANLMIFKINQVLFGDETTYPRLFTHVLPLALFLALRWSENKMPFLYKHFKVVTWAASLVFTIYLTHVVVGFNVIYYLKGIIFNRTLLVVIAMLCSLAVAWLLSQIAEKPSVSLSRSVVNRIRERRRSAENK